MNNRSKHLDFEIIINIVTIQILACYKAISKNNKLVKIKLKIK